MDYRAHRLLMFVLLSCISSSYADGFINYDNKNNYDEENKYSVILSEDGAARGMEENFQGNLKTDELQPYTDQGKFGSGFKGGHSFDRSGSYSGKVDRFGHAYDKSGTYSGRIDRFGNIYDRSGNYSGKVKPKP